RRSAHREAKICSSGSEERLASVRFLTLAPSRNDSRSRYADREPRLGTASTCMATLYTSIPAFQARNTHLHGYIPQLSEIPNPVTSRTFPSFFRLGNAGTSV